MRCFLALNVVEIFPGESVVLSRGTCARSWAPSVVGTCKFQKLVGSDCRIPPTIDLGPPLQPCMANHGGRPIMDEHRIMWTPQIAHSALSNQMPPINCSLQASRIQMPKSTGERAMNFFFLPSPLFSLLSSLTTCPLFLIALWRGGARWYFLRNFRYSSW